MGRFLAFGLLSSFFLGIGFVLLALALLRALQTETGEHFTDHLSWIPYVITLAGCTIVVALAVYAIFSDKRDMKRRQRERATETLS